ncbi:MAG: lysine 6-aminotransferase [Woeseia sp.]|nr:lysine 6-aminotransferase [Woeseia sp.]|tara:strand:+ start:1305 stop:2756 length:1452 start_codon:yes stop_codon:yes gene_type:complete
MRSYAGTNSTVGLPDDIIISFLTPDNKLAKAIESASRYHAGLKANFRDFLELDESEQVGKIQAGFTNFYDISTVNPYVTLAAAGPWIITTKGAVIYDCGGYGMLGLGHAPEVVLTAMNQPHVMANIMTANVSQMQFTDRLEQEVGQKRGRCPFAKFLCLNSGSEANSVAARIADINTKTMTDPGARYAGSRVAGITLAGSFHGRTARPAQYSDSTLSKYRKYLASFRDDEYLLTVEPDDISSLEKAYSDAEKDGTFIEAFFMEPVMGEGNPGRSISPAFYKRARELTRNHGSMFIIDSIQAGLRAHGVLSIVDYPGFETLDAPDMESYSKALNAGQYPLSVLALNEHAASIFRPGVYGNTMTSNPRALDVAVAVLEEVTPELRENICQRGDELLTRFLNLSGELGDAITGVQGTGLLLSCELNERYKVCGINSTEDYLRRNGLGVIHGGAKSLRYTPRFDMTSREVDLIINQTKNALINGPTI